MYWAHSDEDGRPKTDPLSRWQRLNSHLDGVARLAEQLARAARPDNEAWARQARMVGLLHDFGKYTDAFQRRLNGSREKAPHAIHGATVAHRRFAETAAAFAIAGHHAGMHDPAHLKGSIAKQEQTPEISALWTRAVTDLPTLAGLAPEKAPAKHGVDMRTRMLLSCLVDADRLDTEANALGKETRYEPREIDAERLLPGLLRVRTERAARVPEGVVKEVRRQVWEQCVTAAAWPERLLSLTVPTGGAKTLASLAFALERARLGRARRVIIVIPYLSIIEQNAQVFREAFGEDVVLEHHSGNFERLRLKDNALVRDDIDENEDTPERRRPTENWNAPVVVTTSVRFFESILSNRPSDLRRLHHVARSVVILDEVQTLPRHFLSPLLSVMKELADDWGTTFLSCSATQPAFTKPEGALPGDARWEAGTMREVIDDPANLFQRLRRVQVQWPELKPKPWSQVAAEMADEGRALCIVNTRNQAVALYRELQRVHPEAAMHLSTRQCAAHRLAMLAEIRRQMKDEEPCLVSATQLVEAGVDLDFPLVLRALGPLDSIVQAAGRCDREGALTAAAGTPAGRLIVFRTEDGKTPPNAYKEATGITATMLGSGELTGIDDPATMQRYFNLYYGNEADLGKALEQERQGLKFRTVADQFEMIADQTHDVFVPYDQQARELLDKLRAIGQMTSELRRKLQRYVVGLRHHEFQEARIAALNEVRPGSDLWICIEGFYDNQLGFLIKRNAGEMVV